MPKHDAIDYPIGQIQKWIGDGWTQQKISDKLNSELDNRITAKLIYKVCRKHGIKCQRTGPRSGAGHPEWKGGRIVNGSGYVEIYCPDHPNKRSHTPYILEHRLVMEKTLGRLLEKSEVVHHKNGIKDDNRPENLELFDSNAAHLRETLAGQRPKWTPSGERTLSEARNARSQRSNLLRAAIQKELGLDEPPKLYSCYRHLKRRGIGLEEAYEKVDSHEPLQLPPIVHQKRKRGKDGRFL